ncbi:GGDEF domain-containing protein [Granulicella sp. dw_53]|uniref:GGDEF domain-containing protein n=1 Tax=Granulicella sp. dw_53 TaxID=2719792 RepID=UPI001BD6730B|nr:GGDEF domain-containing protein [Granulicella sp. dw_53]
MHLLQSMLTALDATSILIVGFILLFCCSLGLLVVRLTNPRLLGLGWLGSGFASGGVGAWLLTMGGQVPPFFFVILSDFLILLGVVLMHVSTLSMRKWGRVFPRFGACLLLIHLSGYLWMTYVSPLRAGRIVLMGLLVVAQVIQTAVLLFRERKRSVRLPAYLSGTILCCFIAVNLLRSFLLIFHASFMNHERLLALQKVVFLSYLVTAMGLAFNFFWMTTIDLADELEKMASKDPLTRIYNRRVFREWCEQELLRSRRSARPFSLVMADLDHFKQINDRYGHHGGDEALCAVVEKMQDSVRGVDVLGRWGGEEFVALLPGADAEAAVLVAQRVRSNIETLILPSCLGSFADDREEMRMTLSLGVATYRGGEDDLDQMIRRADAALYGAKAAGRNRVLAMA